MKQPLDPGALGDAPAERSRRALLTGLAGGAVATAAIVGGTVAGAAPAWAAGTVGTGGPPPWAGFVLPDGDTSAAVQAAIDKASQDGRGAVYLPSGTYTFSETVTVSQAIYLLCAPNAVINLADGVDGFLFRGYNGNGQQAILPTINGGNRQVRLSGVSVMNLYVGLCQGGEVGVSIEAVDDTVSPVGTLDNNVFFQFMGNMTYGVQFIADAPLPRYLQGNVVNGNFITSSLHAVDFHGNTANDNITINVVNIAAIDGGGVAGATGISLSGVQTFSCGGNTISVPSFFGGFDASVKYSYLNFPNFLNQFYLRAADIGLEYLDLITLTEGGALPYLGGNKVVLTSAFAAPLLNTPAVVAVPDTPDLSQFNGGSTLAYNCMRASCAVKALPAGASQDFYVFNPLLDGYSDNIQVTLQDDGGYPFTVAAQDESVFAGSDGLSGPAQLHLRLRTPVATQATTVTMTIALNA